MAGTAGARRSACVVRASNARGAAATARRPGAQGPQALPLFDERRIATFLQDLGHDPLSRAKAVRALEQQYEALHRTLKVWAREGAGRGARTLPCGTTAWPVTRPSSSSSAVGNMPR